MTANPPTLPGPTYQPRPNSKPAKLLAFLKDQPEATLTADDMADQFGMQRNTVHTLLRPALDAKLLRRDRDLLGEYRYRAGPALAKAALPTTDAAADDEAAADDWPSAPGAARSYSKVAVDPAVFAKLQPETDVPFTDLAAAPGGKWAPLFDKLTTNGQSIAFPLDWQSAVAATSLKRNRTAPDHTWRVRKVSDTQARLWRLAK